MIFSKTFIMNTIAKYGIVPILVTIGILVGSIAHQMSTHLNLFKRLFIGALS